MDTVGSSKIFAGYIWEAFKCLLDTDKEHIFRHSPGLLKNITSTPIVSLPISQFQGKLFIEIFDFLTGMSRS